MKKPLIEKKCICGEVFFINQSDDKRGRGKYCGNICKNRYNKGKFRDGHASLTEGLVFVDKVRFICKCGKEYFKYPSQIKEQNSSYCSNKCKYLFNTSYRCPKGVNRGSKFKKGHIPVTFKGDYVGYSSLHKWVRKHNGSPSVCEHCGKTEGRIEWANKSHEYKRDLSDWIALCKKCHVYYDVQSGNFGVATKKYNLVSRKKKKDPKDYIYHRRKVVQFLYGLNGQSRIWPSINQAARELGISHSGIIRCCKGDCNTCGGYYWKYKSDCNV
jgi:hypothetical protein